MFLYDLLREYDCKMVNVKNVEIKNISKVADESCRDGIYFCLKGNTFDGKDFASKAIKCGAFAVVCEGEVSPDIPQIQVKDARKAMADISARFFGNPQVDLKIIGVVGTNGKTTVCHMIESILKRSGKNVGIIGTLGVRYANNCIYTDRTTPDPIEFFSILADMKKSNVEYVVTEVSAHAIFYSKLNPVKFSALVFTNLSEDHLDFFTDMQTYAKIKESVFCKDNANLLISNSDDELGRRIILSNNGVVSYGIKEPADVFAINVKQSENGISYVVNAFDEISTVESTMIGSYNVYNTLASIACCVSLGVDLQSSVRGIKDLQFIDGRCQKAGEFNGAKIYVDYAHTPDGLKQSLESLGDICEGKLVCLFGCGGNRDKIKRPIMGEIAATYADYTVITTDNPRFEDPCCIISEIERGVRKVSLSYITIKDRIDAIDYAIDLLSEGDVLLVAGKGGEKTQEIMGQKKELDDVKIINDVIKIKNWSNSN